jgi:hypothetical protein
MNMIDYKTLEGQTGAQGDVQFRAVATLPADARPMKAVDGQYIIAHSETGHSHVIKEQEGIEVFESANDNSVIYLRVNNTTALLKHLRDWDTHQAWSFSDGIYTMRRQCESWLEGFRKAQD